MRKIWSFGSNRKR